MLVFSLGLVILLFIGVIGAASEKVIELVVLFSALLIPFSMLLSFAIMQDEPTYNDGVKDALSGKVKYDITYKKTTDSTFVPVDTIIIKK